MWRNFDFLLLGVNRGALLQTRMGQSAIQALSRRRWKQQENVTKIYDRILAEFRINSEQP